MFNKLFITEYVIIDFGVFLWIIGVGFTTLSKLKKKYDFSKADRM